MVKLSAHKESEINGLIKLAIGSPTPEKVQKILSSSDGRYFTDYNERSLRSLLEQFADLTIIDICSREDSASDRKGRMWINGLVRKDKL